SRRLFSYRAGRGEHRRLLQHDDGGRRRRDVAAEGISARARLHPDAGIPVLRRQAERGGPQAVSPLPRRRGGGGVMTQDRRTRVRRGSDEANHYAARLLQHLVVPTFVIDADRRVVVWNRACERLTGVPATEVLGTRNHWQGFYEDNRYCLADLVALGRQDLIGELYSEFVVTQDDRLGSSAGNWGMVPRLRNHLYLAIDARPIHDDDGH